MERLAMMLAGIVLAAAPVLAQDKGYPIPKQAKFIELDGTKYAVPKGATHMRVETQFVKAADRDPKLSYGAIPSNAKTYRGAKVPPGATHYRSVLKFVRPNKRGIADVLDDRKAEGTHEVEVPVKPPSAAPRPPAETTPSTNEPPATATPPANRPPASRPPASKPPATQPKPPTVKRVTVQIDY